MWEEPTPGGLLWPGSPTFPFGVLSPGAMCTAPKCACLLCCPGHGLGVLVSAPVSLSLPEEALPGEALQGLSGAGRPCALLSYTVRLRPAAALRGWGYCLSPPRSPNLGKLREVACSE